MQLDLVYRKVVAIYPRSYRGTARQPTEARVDDGLDYMLKDDSQGEPVRAQEWICHRLADAAGLPVVEHRPIATLDGKVVFGSRMVLNGNPGSSLLGTTLPAAEAERVLSAIYAVDLFLGNGDRHINNLIIEQDVSPRIRVIDFSECRALLDPSSRALVQQTGTNTLIIGRALRNRYGFSTSAAELALDRLDALTSDKFEGILAEMPRDWLDPKLGSDLRRWWLSPARKDRMMIVRVGLFNGTLL